MVGLGGLSHFGSEQAPRANDPRYFVTPCTRIYIQGLSHVEVAPGRPDPPKHMAFCLSLSRGPDWLRLCE